MCVCVCHSCAVLVNVFVDCFCLSVYVLTQNILYCPSCSECVRSDQMATPCCLSCYVYHGIEWMLYSCTLCWSSTLISWCMEYRCTCLLVHVSETLFCYIPVPWDDLIALLWMLQWKVVFWVNNYRSVSTNDTPFTIAYVDRMNQWVSYYTTIVYIWGPLNC